MIRRLFTRFSEWLRDGARTPSFPDDRPPSRLGCVDVDIFATPSTDDEATFLQKVEQLKKAQRDERALSTELIGYFGRRYHEKGIRRWVGCPFDVYLERPLVVEEIRDDLAPTS